MTQELIYTSAPRGLKPGSRGFCTVLSTRGMSAPLAAALESLSGYRALYPPNDPRVDQNPTVHSHVSLTVAGKTYSVLSRISDYGLDYSQRANKIAHHLVLDRRELVPGGPAAVLAEPGMMESSWDGEPRVIATGRSISGNAQPPAICQAWREATGDAGWAGVLAESFQADPQRQAYLVVEPGMDLLALIREAIALLPAELRWNATFSTYFTSLPPSATCLWRCVLAGSPEAQQSRRFVQALRIDLTKPASMAIGGALVEQARTGRIAAPESAPIVHPTPAAEPDVPVPLAEGGSPSVAIDREISAATSGTKVPPPPLRKRTRTLADVPDAPRRGWLVPSVTALVVLLLIGGAGAGVYRWLADGDLAGLVARGGEREGVGEGESGGGGDGGMGTHAVGRDGREAKNVEREDAVVDPMPTKDSEEEATKAKVIVDAGNPPSDGSQESKLTENMPSDESDPSQSANGQETPAPAPFLYVVLPEPTTINKDFDLSLTGLHRTKSSEDSLAVLIPEEFGKHYLRVNDTADSAQFLKVQFRTAGWIDLVQLAVKAGDKGSVLYGKWLNNSPDHRKRLRWCALAVGKDAPQFVLFRDSPRKLSQEFKNGTVTWPLTRSLVDMPARELTFHMDLAVSANGAVFRFQGTIREQPSDEPLTLSTYLHPVTLSPALYKATGVELSEAHNWQFPITVEAFLDTESLRLRFSSMDEFHDELLDQFDLFLIRDDKNSVYTVLTDPKNRELFQGKGKAFQINYTLLLKPTYVTKVKTDIGDWHNIWKQRRNDENYKDRHDEFVKHGMALAEIAGSEKAPGRIDELVEIAKRIESLKSSLKSATITSAHIYYKVHGPNGETLEVPIINIPETKPPKSVSTPQPTTDS